MIRQIENRFEVVGVQEFKEYTDLIRFENNCLIGLIMFLLVLISMNYYLIVKRNHTVPAGKNSQKPAGRQAADIHNIIRDSGEV